MNKIIDRIDKGLNGLITYIVVAMLAVMSVVVFAQVIFRLVHASIPWSEEVSKYLLIWCTFLGASLCIRKGSLVGLEIIYAMMPKKMGKMISIGIQGLTTVLLIFLIVVGAETAKAVWVQTTPVLKLPMGLMYAAIPVSAVFMLINTIIIIYYLVCGEGDKE